MGNYGNTSDRWYRRAALVIWSAEQGFATRAEASPAWALQTILSSLAAGEPKQAREEVQALLRVWGGAPQESLLAPALEVAAGIEDPDLAEELLAPFAVEMLGEEHAAALGVLARTYPMSWWGSVAGRWGRGRGRAYGNPDRPVWVETTLVPLCRELEAVDAQGVVDWLVAWMSGWFLDTVAAQVRSESVIRREEALERLGPVLAPVLKVADDQNGVELGEQVCALGDVVLPLLVATVRAHQPPVNAAMSVIARQARGSLKGLLAQPIRADGDVSIAWTSPGGEDADRLGRFLTSATEVTLEWPLAEQRRRAIHHLITTADLPVSHVTRRTGRPYTLVLKKKTAELVAREASARSSAEENLAYLQRVLRAPAIPARPAVSPRTRP